MIAVFFLGKRGNILGQGWGKKTNKQGPLKATLHKGDLKKNLCGLCANCIFKRYYYFKTSTCATFFSVIIITYQHRSTPLRKERPDQLKMWSNMNFMLKALMQVLEICCITMQVQLIGLYCTFTSGLVGEISRFFYPNKKRLYVFKYIVLSPVNVPARLIQIVIRVRESMLLIPPFNHAGEIIKLSEEANKLFGKNS